VAKEYVFPIPVGSYAIQGNECQPSSSHPISRPFLVTFYWGPVHYVMGGVCNRDIR
jgi:hypothetical protein